MEQLEKVKVLFVDEFSLTPNVWMTKLYEGFLHGREISLFGDQEQCLPVETSTTFDYLNSKRVRERCQNIEALR